MAALHLHLKRLHLVEALRVFQREHWRGLMIRAILMGGPLAILYPLQSIVRSVNVHVHVLVHINVLFTLVKDRENYLTKARSTQSTIEQKCICIALTIAFRCADTSDELRYAMTFCNDACTPPNNSLNASTTQ